jgi:hypothetical protein
MTQPSIITDEMRAVIGQESDPQTVEVDRSAVRMFARAVGHTDPVFYDVEEARRRGYRDLPCPPAFLGTPVFVPNQPARAVYTSFKSPFTRVLNGGTEVEYFDQHICAGDVLTSTTKIADLGERQGSLGPMLIIRFETTCRNQQGKVVAILRGTGIQY